MSIKYNPLDGSLYPVPDDVIEASKRLEVSKIANEDLALGDPVKMDDETSCSKSGVDTRANASVVGICVSDALAGEAVDILLIGIIENVLFASIPFGASIFQTSAGGVTVNATTIIGEFYTRIGKSYGNGVILVSPEEPVEVA